MLQVSTEGRAIVMAAFVQRSTVLSKSRGKMFENGDELDPLYPPGDMYWGVHGSSCGHAMHSDCWQGFYESVMVKERRALRLRRYVSVDISRREFLCPLCSCIANTVLPVLPTLSYGQGPRYDYSWLWNQIMFRWTPLALWRAIEGNLEGYFSGPCYFSSYDGKRPVKIESQKKKRTEVRKNDQNKFRKSPEGARKYVGSDVIEWTCFLGKLAGTCEFDKSWSILVILKK